MYLSAARAQTELHPTKVAQRVAPDSLRDNTVTVTVVVPQRDGDARQITNLDGGYGSPVAPRLPETCSKQLQHLCGHQSRGLGKDDRGTSDIDSHQIPLDGI